MTDETEEEWAYLGWASAAQHSTVTRLAPTAETALTIKCGRRVLARVWPWGAPISDQFIVTTRGMEPVLSRRWPACAAPCACRLRAHLIDRAKLVDALKDVVDVQPSRQPSVQISGVARDRSDSDT